MQNPVKWEKKNAINNILGIAKVISSLKHNRVTHMWKILEGSINSVGRPH